MVITGRTGAGKGRHFLASKEARRLSVSSVARLDDEQAYKLLCAIRWCDTGGDPVCPHCGCMAVYKHASRKIFSCKACTKQFSVTSGTILHSRKMPIRDILVAIALFVNGVKGHSALHLSRDLCREHKTCFVLLHKLRDAMGRETAGRMAEGVVEIDGAYFGGYVKPTNYAENRRDRRLAKNQSGKRRVLIVMRERGGRTMPFVVRKESQSESELTRRIVPGTVIHADETRSWDGLQHYHGYDMLRINHQEAYSDGQSSTNLAESFFSRIRRAEIGMHHHIAGPYLGDYGHEMAWREDARRIDNATQFLMVGLAALTSSSSPRWRGYWQRSRKA
jgi:transposase-like protein